VTRTMRRGWRRLLKRLHIWRWRRLIGLVLLWAAAAAAVAWYVELRAPRPAGRVWLVVIGGALLACLCMMLGRAFAQPTARYRRGRR
jgi:purine-cytosine permease-like protein